MIFKNATDEELVCNVLRGYVEEFGPEAVIVRCPANWKNLHKDNRLGKVLLVFTTENTIEIEAKYSFPLLRGGRNFTGGYSFKMELENSNVS